MLLDLEPVQGLMFGALVFSHLAGSTILCPRSISIYLPTTIQTAQQKDERIANSNEFRIRDGPQAVQERLEAV